MAGHELGHESSLILYNGIETLSHIPGTVQLPISDLPARPKSRMPEEASHGKLFPWTPPAQLLPACISGSKFGKTAAWLPAPALCHQVWLHLYSGHTCSPCNHIAPYITSYSDPPLSTTIRLRTQQESQHNGIHTSTLRMHS
jgi:hypothetical protein